MNDSLLLVSAVVAFPIGGALFALLMPGEDRLALRQVGMVAMIGSACCALFACRMALSAPVAAAVGAVRLGLDGFSAPVLLSLAVGAPIALRAGAPRVLERSQFYVATMLFAHGLLAAAVLVRDPVLKLGLASISSVPMFALVALFGGPLRGTTTYRAALIWIGVDVVALSVLALLAARAHVLPGEATAGALGRGFAGLDATARVLVTVAVAGPGLLRLAAGPFSVWLQPFLDEAPVSAALIATAGAAPLGVLLLVDVALPVAPGGMLALAGPVALLCAGAALLSGVIAYAERDLRRMLAQLIFLAAATATPALLGDSARAVATGLIHVVVVGATAGLLLVVVEATERRFETRDGFALTGLSSTAPLLAALLALGLVGLVGVPGICAGGTAWLTLAAVATEAGARVRPDGDLLPLWLATATALSHLMAGAGVLGVLRRLFAPPTARGRRDLVRVTFPQAVRLLVPALVAVGSGLAAATLISGAMPQAMLRVAPLPASTEAP